MDIHVNVEPKHISVISIPPNVGEKRFIRPSTAAADEWPMEEGVWWISRVLVNGERGKGTGSTLLQRLIEEVRKRGAKAMIVAPGGYNSNYNQQVNFYVKNGFKEVNSEGLYRLELQS